MLKEIRLIERTKLIEYMKVHGIWTLFHYIPLHSSPAGIKYGRAVGDMHVTNDLSNRVLRLPMYYEMSNDDVDRISERMYGFYKR